MLEFVIVSSAMVQTDNPFVVGVCGNMPSRLEGIAYMVHTFELAVRLFPQADYMSDRITDGVYWFSDESDMERVIFSLLPDMVDCRTIVDLKSFDISGNVFYVEEDGRLYLYNNGVFSYANLRILSVLNGRKVDLGYVLEDNYHGSREMKVLMKEHGLIDETYSEENYLRFLRKKNMTYCICLLYESIWKRRHVNRTDYKIGGRYPNPYENILLLEEHFNGMRYHNIDIDKCIEYDLKYDRLPASYDFNGFYTTTGRIFCSSQRWSPIQSVPRSKRDILYADGGCVLVEFDYRSFEFDILCQLIGSPVKEDPHAYIYDRLVGLPHDRSRDIGKRINYSFIYGMNQNRLVDSIVADFDQPPPSLKEVILKRLQEEEIIHKLKEFEHRIVSTVSGDVVVNYFGRSIHFKKDFAVLNNYISSTAADFINNKMLLLIDMLEGRNKLLLQNFDSILVQLDKACIEGTTILEDILELLGSPIGGIVGRVSYKYGDNWGSLS